MDSFFLFIPHASLRRLYGFCWCGSGQCSVDVMWFSLGMYVDVDGKQHERQRKRNHGKARGWGLCCGVYLFNNLFTALLSVRGH